ncbi:TPA: hypothetical protein RQN22_001824 [Aeromonas dhakensis]|nr:hypothetical protein [Aeromonas dhakensis]
MKNTAPYKFVSEIAESLGLEVKSSKERADSYTTKQYAFYYISENGLNVFTHDHKVTIFYQADEEKEAVTNTIFPSEDLKLAVISAYKEARIREQKRKEEIYG